MSASGVKQTSCSEVVMSAFEADIKGMSEKSVCVDVRVALNWQYCNLAYHPICYARASLKTAGRDHEIEL